MEFTVRIASPSIMRRRFTEGVLLRARNDGAMEHN
jgi:hypothetical protein